MFKVHIIPTRIFSQTLGVIILLTMNENTCANQV